MPSVAGARRAGHQLGIGNAGNQFVLAAHSADKMFHSAETKAAVDPNRIHSRPAHIAAMVRT